MSKGSNKAPDSRALYRKYRSKTLDEIVGQDHVTNILSRSLQQGKIAHAYLLTGPKGVGKTSIARILAHEINNLPYDEDTTHLDIIEIDAASNNGVDDVRDLRDKVQVAPVSANKKVYIIDEVHMLSKAAFNALLKTLEEPPEHVVFILATTDLHKVPDTILSRTQRFTFRSISLTDATRHLRSIADSEKITIDDEALALIAEHGDGSFRDSISLLDQLRGLSDGSAPISAELVEQVVGLAPKEELTALLTAYEQGATSTVVATLDSLEQRGVEPVRIINQLITLLRPRLVTEQHWLTLLNRLVEALRSPRPDVLLLTALLSSSTVTPSTPTTPKKSVATSVTATVAPELTPLAKEATKPRPSELHLEKEIQKQDPQPAPQQPPVKKKSSASVVFVWDTYLAHMKEHHLALSSILAKCKPEVDGDILRLYTGTAFWKKKLDDPRYQPLLHQGLTDTGTDSLTIETVPTGPPLRDSQAAAVAAIMGGGEEVQL